MRSDLRDTSRKLSITSSLQAHLWQMIGGSMSPSSTCKNTTVRYSLSLSIVSTYKKKLFLLKSLQVILHFPIPFSIVIIIVAKIEAILSFHTFLRIKKELQLLKDPFSIDIHIQHPLCSIRIKRCVRATPLPLSCAHCTSTTHIFLGTSLSPRARKIVRCTCPGDSTRRRRLTLAYLCRRMGWGYFWPDAAQRTPPPLSLSFSLSREPTRIFAS